MLIPDSYPADLRAKIRKRFFGKATSPDIAILTPINSIFEGVGRDLRRGGGWWKTYSGSFFLIVLTPQGSPVLDAISVLEPKTSITFLGLAGSLGAKKIGSVVEAEWAFVPGTTIGMHPRSFEGEFLFPKVTIASVGCLAESMASHRTFARKSDCVDMETGLIYAACKKQDKYVRSIQIVSDDFESNPFFRVSIKKLDGAKIHLAQIMKTYLANL